MIGRSIRTFCVLWGIWLLPISEEEVQSAENQNSKKGSSFLLLIFYNYSQISIHYRAIFKCRNTNYLPLGHYNLPPLRRFHRWSRKSLKINFGFCKHFEKRSSIFVPVQLIQKRSEIVIVINFQIEMVYFSLGTLRSHFFWEILAFSWGLFCLFKNKPNPLRHVNYLFWVSILIHADEIEREALIS